MKIVTWNLQWARPGTWRGDAHVSSGRGDRAPWQEHLDFCRTLESLLKGLPEDQTAVVVGDFNQRFPRRRQPAGAHQSLCAALHGFDVITGATDGGGELIDHVAVRPSPSSARVVVHSNEVDGKALSDHVLIEATIG